MRFITSFSRKLFKDYAHRLTQSYGHHLWEHGNLICYSEDMTPGISGCIEVRDLNFPDLVKFKKSCQPTEDYRYDAAKFSNKIWAMVEGSMNESGMCFWIDADCVIYRKPSLDYLRRLIPPQYYLGSFQRASYVETGFWGVRASHPEHKAFMTALKAVYTSGKIFELPQWHDCYALDYTRQHFQYSGRIKAVNLTQTLDGKGSHVMATSQLGKYIDHLKGPRKDLGYSPENKWHKELHERGRESVLGDGQRSDHSQVS